MRALVLRCMPFMLTCAELEEFVVQYLDEKLSWRQRLIFNLHLAVCPECQLYLERYQYAIALGKGAFVHPERSALEEAPEELIRAILAARSQEGH